MRKQHWRESLSVCEGCGGYGKLHEPNSPECAAERNRQIREAYALRQAIRDERENITLGDIQRRMVD